MKDQKALYKIGEVTAVLGVTPRTIRHYEAVGLLPRAKRSSGRVRLFDQDDLDLIRNIRQLQKEEGLSLEQIKEQLYGKRSDGNIILVTDDSANIMPEAYPFLKVLDLDSLQESQIFEQFKSLYQAQFDRGAQCIYSIHSSAPYSNITEIARRAASTIQDNHRIRVIGMPILGSALGLLAHLMGDHIQKHCLDQELQRLIEEVRPYMGMIFALSSIASLYSGNSAGFADSGSDDRFTESLKQGMAGVMPIFMQSAAVPELVLKKFVSPQDELLTMMADAFEQELGNRDRFLSYVAITHYHQLEKALALSDILQDRHIKVPILVLEEKPSLKSILGQQFLGISFV